MSLTLHFHPLSSFCQKALIGLYELDVAFTKNVVDLGDEPQRAALVKLWPIGKFPVLSDDARGQHVPETTIILDYIDQHFATTKRLTPTDPERARECRLRDRFFDLYVNTPMGKAVTDKLRPAGRNDPLGVDHAKAQIETAYGIADEWLREGPWAIGAEFSLADCAAAPSLFFSRHVVPFGDKRHLSAYFARLCERPSVARTFAEAQPYMDRFPG